MSDEIASTTQIPTCQKAKAGKKIRSKDTKRQEVAKKGEKINQGGSMSKTARGVQDGTGPFKGSARGKVGRRKAAGLPCPAKKKPSKKSK